MGVCETLTEFKPGMHWQQHQDRHHHMLVTPYDPSRDLSPNLPTTTSSCQESLSMSSLSSNGGSSGAHSCRSVPGSNSSSGCSTPVSSITGGAANGRLTSIGVGPPPIATMCCGGSFKEEYEPSPVIQHVQTSSYSSKIPAPSDCQDCAAAAVAAAAVGNQQRHLQHQSYNKTTSAASAASAVTVGADSSPYDDGSSPVVCKTEDCRSGYSPSPSPLPLTPTGASSTGTAAPYSIAPPPPAIGLHPSSHLYDYHHQRSPIDYPGPPALLRNIKRENHRNVSEPTSPGEEDSLKICAGCGARIADRFYLYAVDRQWHVSCLQCCQCGRTLDDEVTCFARDGNIYCRKDYQKLFGVNRCSRCRATILSTELVMRVRECVFHLPCFFCVICMTVLHKGDHFGMRDGQVYCRLHYESLSEPQTQLPIVNSRTEPVPAAPDSGGSTYSPGSSSPRFLVPLSVSSSTALQTLPSPEYSPDRRLLQLPTPPVAHSPAIPLLQNVSQTESIQQKLNNSFYNGVSISNPRPKGRPRKRKPKEIDSMNTSIDNINSDSYIDLPYSNSSANGSSSLNSSNHHHHHHHQRTKRMRTSFKHHQLRTMKTYFTVNHNPDAKDLKQLSQKTGLGKRVLQVWFQNARAKWRRMMNKQDGGGGGGGAGSVLKLDEKSCSESSGPTLDSVYHGGSLSLGTPHSPQDYMSPSSSLDCSSS